MTRKVLVFSFVMMLLSGGSWTRAQEAMAILPVQSVPDDPSVRFVVEDLLSTAINQKGRFRLVERVQIQQVLEEMNLSMTGLIDENTARKVGQLIGAGDVVLGRIVFLNGVYRLSLKLITVESGELKATSTAQGSVDQLEQMVEDACFEVFPDFELMEIRFFESGFDVTPLDQRAYGAVFNQYDTRVINYEVHFKNLLYGIRDQNFTIIAEYYNPSGQVLTTLEWPAFIKKEWFDSYHNRGWGWTTAGNWPLGQYNVRIHVRNVLIGIGTFSIQ